MPYKQFGFFALYEKAANHFSSLEQQKNTDASVFTDDDKETDYMVTIPQKQDFMQLSYSKIPPGKGKFFIPKGEGWKFHVSINDNNQNALSLAWDIVVEILIKHKAEGFKICKPNVHMDNQDPKASSEFHYAQRGKQITIYDFNDYFENNRVQKWQEILTEITKRFVQNNIPPSYRTPYDKPVEGSSYFTYRTDENLHGTRSKKYNPFNKNDPFLGHLRIEIEDQPQPLLDKNIWTQAEKVENEKKSNQSHISANTNIYLNEIMSKNLFDKRVQPIFENERKNTEKEAVKQQSPNQI